MDFRAVFKQLRSEHGLYIHINITDIETITANDYSWTDVWQVDNIEIFSHTYCSSLKSEDSVHACYSSQIKVQRGNNEFLTEPLNREHEPGEIIDWKVVETDRGWAHEWRIP